jgi:L-iditol 2-dehydrogenase
LINNQSVRLQRVVGGSGASAWCLEAPERFVRCDGPDGSGRDLESGEVLLRMLTGGICGSDLPYYRGAMHQQMPNRDRGAAGIPGYPMHEVVGEVVVSRDPHVEVGSRVVGWASIFNGLAQYVVNHGRDLFAYDASFDPGEAIVLQPLACVLGAMNDLGDVTGAKVAVLGQGSIGLLFSHVAKQRGAGTVIGVDRVDRSDCSSDLGVDECVHSSIDGWVASLAPTDAPDIVIEAVGHQVGTFTRAVEAVAVGGRIYYFGIPDDEVYPLNMKSLLRKRLTLQSGWVLPDQRRRLLGQANDYLIAHPKLAGSIVTHTFDFDEVPEAYAVAATPRAGQLKVTIRVDR